MKWLDNLERKLGKYYIKNLMFYVIILNAFVYMLTFMTGSYSLINKLTLSPNAVLNGEVWRLITFVFIPPITSIIWIAFTLYFYYMAGNGLEHAWGGFKFNVYYLVGIVSTIVISFATGSVATGTLINLSLFLAFAREFPDMELLIFFIIPVKVKYLGYINWAIIIFNLVMTPGIGGKLLVLAPVANFIIFFGKDIINGGASRTKSYSRKQKYKSHLEVVGPRHKCTVCGITDKDDPNMEFRYCSKCNGHYGYCMNHIRNHEHIK